MDWRLPPDPTPHPTPHPQGNRGNESQERGRIPRMNSHSPFLSHPLGQSSLGLQGNWCEGSSFWRVSEPVPSLFTLGDTGDAQRSSFPHASDFVSGSLLRGQPQVECIESDSNTVKNILHFLDVFTNTHKSQAVTVRSMLWGVGGFMDITTTVLLSCC